MVKVLMLMLLLQTIQIKLYEKFVSLVCTIHYIFFSVSKFNIKKKKKNFFNPNIKQTYTYMYIYIILIVNCVVVQNAEICLYSSTQYKCDVAVLEAR